MAPNDAELAEQATSRPGPLRRRHPGLFVWAGGFSGAVEIA